MALMDMPNAGLTRALILFTRLDERYERLLLEKQWKTAPKLEELTKDLQGRLTEALSPKQLDNLKPLMQMMVDRYGGRIRQQKRDGYSPRVLDLAYVLLCEDALDTIEMAKK